MTEGTGARRRSFWLKHLHQWHWISAGACLIGMLLFAITGITLNHAGVIEATPVTSTRTATLPGSMRTELSAMTPATGANAKRQAPLPAAVVDWLRETLDVRAAQDSVEWSPGEVYVALPRPGGDAFVTIDLQSGEATYERTDRGWIAYLNDLHKGRHTGAAWSLFLDVFAIACIVFASTGCVLLALHARQRPRTWPVVSLGLVAPLVIALLFIH